MKNGIEFGLELSLTKPIIFRPSIRLVDLDGVRLFDCGAELTFPDAPQNTPQKTPKLLRLKL